MTLTRADKALIDAALAVRQNAYAPWSGFRVGAALRDDAGRMHAAVNVENAAFPLGACAETGAISAMVAAGGRRIVAIAIAGGADREAAACTPCGGCRQRIAEFADAETRVLLLDASGAWRALGIDELLPGSFRLG